MSVEAVEGANIINWNDFRSLIREPACLGPKTSNDAADIFPFLLDYLTAMRL
jgi:hypothetical protein